MPAMCVIKWEMPYTMQIYIPNIYIYSIFIYLSHINLISFREFFHVVAVQAIWQHCRKWNVNQMKIFVVQFSGQQSKRVENGNNKKGILSCWGKNMPAFVIKFFPPFAFDYSTAAAYNVLVFVFRTFPWLFRWEENKISFTTNVKINK